MKLLILTQKIDISDPVLGFFHSWVIEFAKYCDKVTVICLEKGGYELPSNVKVISMGKERRSGNARLRKYIFRWFYVFKFYKYIWQEKKNYDFVFAHMNPEYVVMGGMFWKLWRKKVSLWYVHRNVDFKLRLAEKMVDFIFTASEESFQLPSKKIKILGHGIDTTKFKIQNSRFKTEKNIFKIVYVGRISEIKNQKLLIEAVNILVNKWGKKNIRVDFVGIPVYDKDREYLAMLKKMTEENKLNNNIEFKGSIFYKDMPPIYNNAYLSINLCPTGGLDKAVLESMASGCLVVTSNQSFKNILPSSFLVLESNPLKLAEIIQLILELPENEKNKIRLKMRNEIIEKYSLERLIDNIVKSF